MKYYKAKYILFKKKSEDTYKLINEVTLDQFLIKSHLKELIESFIEGQEIKNYLNNPKIKDDCHFLIEKKILISEELYKYETYTSQIPKETYFGIRPHMEGLDNKIIFHGIPFGKGNPSDFRTSFFPSKFRSFSKVISLLEDQHFLSFPIGAVLNKSNLKNVQTLINDDRLRDNGDLFIHQFESSSKAYEKIEYTYDKIFKVNNIPFSLGGDHSITYPILKALGKTNEAFNVLHFDAHTDIYENRFLDISDDPEFFHHGSFVTKSLKIESLKKYIMLGLRSNPTGTINSKIDFYDIGKLKGFLKKGGKIDLGIEGKTYITFDIDILDPVYAPGTATPVPFGLNPFEVLDVLNNCLEGIDIVGIDFVEVNPERDHHEATMNIAMNLIIGLLSYLK
jgi:agmatinase